MPLYDYHCQACDTAFSHLWRTLAAATGSTAPACPVCGSQETQRVVSRVTVLGELGGLTPGEKASENKAENAQWERVASMTPKDQIDKLRAGKKRPA